MTIGTLLRDIVHALWQRPATRQYPSERAEPSPRLRGALQWDPSRCTGCAMCTRDCPANAIELITLDKANKRFVLRYHLDRCTFCAQCVETCRFGCLNMASDRWELAALSKEPFVLYYGEETDVNAVLANRPKPDSPASPGI